MCRMKDLVTKITGLFLFAAVVIGADKLPSAKSNANGGTEDFSIFARPSSEELRIPKYFSANDLGADAASFNSFEDLFADYSDLDLLNYLPPASSLAEFAAPSSQLGPSAPGTEYGAPPAATKSDHPDLLSFLQSSDSYSAPLPLEDSKESYSSNSFQPGFGKSVSYGTNDNLHQGISKGMPYNFGYVVQDEYTKNDYGHKESSDGDVVKGEYRVLLPDGRTQIVSYTADHVKGYQADVRYEGEAKFPEPIKYQGLGSKQNSYSFNQLGRELSNAPQHQNFGQSKPPQQSNFAPQLQQQSYDVSSQLGQLLSNSNQPTYRTQTSQKILDSPKLDVSYIPPSPQQSQNPLKLQQSNGGSSYTSPNSKLIVSVLQPQQNFQPLKQKQNHAPQQQIISSPQQNYSPPQISSHSQVSFKPLKLQNSFSSSKPQESYTQPILQQGFIIPQPPISYNSKQTQQSFIIPQPRQNLNTSPSHQSFSLSEPHQSSSVIQPQLSSNVLEPEQSYSPPESQQSFTIPEHQQSFSISAPQQSFSIPEPQQSFSIPETQQSFIIPEPQQSFSIPEPQPSYSISEPQQSISVHETQQSYRPSEPLQSSSSPESQQSYNLPEPQQSYSPPEPQQSYSPPEPQQNYSPPESQQSSSPPEPQQSYSPPEPQQNYSPPEPQQSSSSIGKQETQINLDSASISLYSPPTDSFGSSQTGLNVDLNYLPPPGPEANSISSSNRYRKRSPASSLGSRPNRIIIFKPSRRIPEDFLRLKSEKSSEIAKENLR